MFFDMSYEELELQVNTAGHHLELVLEGSTAFIDYKLTDGRLFLIHTEVPAVLEGRDVAAALVTKVFVSQPRVHPLTRRQIKTCWPTS